MTATPTMRPAGATAARTPEPGRAGACDPGATVAQRIRSLPWREALMLAQAEGWTGAQVARARQVDQGAVSDACRRYGVSLGDARCNPARVERLKALAAAGALQIEAAEAEGIHSSAVYGSAQRHGIRFRRAHERLDEWLAAQAAALPAGTA